VDSHLIPKALTRPAVPGQSFVQAGMGSRPIRRWDSWYDPALTIRKGEDILADLDDWAIQELRKHELVWSGWKGAGSLANNVNRVPGMDIGFREIMGIDPVRLRLFFLSLLWRAAATNRPEFSAVSLPPDDQEQLRLMLLSGDPGPLDFYPTQLIQLYTLGEIHNHTPIADSKKIDAFDGTPPRQIQTFRFYFDGLVAHIHRHASDDSYTVSQNFLTVGHSDKLMVAAVPYETSFQQDLLMEMQRQAAATWPDVLEKLSPKADRDPSAS
jgi:hypothetical protein